MPKRIDRGVSVSWSTPQRPFEKLALECMQYLRGSPLAEKLEGCNYVIMIERTDVITGTVECGAMATLPSLQKKGFEDCDALAAVLSMHLNAIKEFLREVPGMKSNVLKLLRDLATDA